MFQTECLKTSRAMAEQGVIGRESGVGSMPMSIFESLSNAVMPSGAVFLQQSCWLLRNLETPGRGGFQF